MRDPGAYRRPAPLLAALSMGSSAVFVIALLVLMAWPIPRHLRLSPGPSPDVVNLIKVEGAETYESKGKLSLALVVVAPADNLFEVARARLDEQSELFPRELLIPEDTSDQENDQQNARLMTTSQQDATYVALEFLGYDVRATGKGARVIQVVEDKPAAGALQPGDVITAVDGQEVKVSDDAVQKVVAREVGAPVHFTVDRDGMVVEVDVVTVESPTEAGRPIVGVTLETQEPSYDLPPGLKVEIDADGIGGPSAGLVYTLGIIDLLTPDDLAGGHDVAASGEIRLDGTVGPIGGLREKAIGVEQAGADYFLVPAGDNYDEATRAAKGMRVVPVNTLDEALEFLRGLRGGTELVKPTTTG